MVPTPKLLTRKCIYVTPFIVTHKYITCIIGRHESDGYCSNVAYVIMILITDASWFKIIHIYIISLTILNFWSFIVLRNDMHPYEKNSSTSLLQCAFLWIISSLVGSAFSAGGKGYVPSLCQRIEYETVLKYSIWSLFLLDLLSG